MFPTDRWANPSPADSITEPVTASSSGSRKNLVMRRAPKIVEKRIGGVGANVVSRNELLGSCGGGASSHLDIEVFSAFIAHHAVGPLHAKAVRSQGRQRDRGRARVSIGERGNGLDDPRVFKLRPLALAEGPVRVEEPGADTSGHRIPANSLGGLQGKTST